MAQLKVESFKALRQMAGQTLPKGEWITVTQDMINAFARATLDDQWIHTDIERAKKASPFGTTVAHGFLSLALVSAMIGRVVALSSMTMGVNYGLNRVRFPSPVPVNGRVRLLCRVGDIDETDNGGLRVVWHCEVELENSNKPACVCELISLVFE